MARFTVRLYSDFGMVPQDQTRILFESDDLTDIKNKIKDYFKQETYFNAVYFIDNKLDKSGYVGRDLTIGCGDNLFNFCEEPELECDSTKNNKSEEFVRQLMANRDYWLNETRAKTAKEKLDGFLFSILVMFDGCSGTNDYHLITLVDDKTKEIIACEGSECLHDIFSRIDK